MKAIGMKKYLGILFLYVMVLGLCACGGNTDNVKTQKIDSEIYSQEDISAAISDGERIQE